MKKIFIVLSLTVLFAFSGANIFACSCSIYTRTEIEALPEAEISRFANVFDAIFTGQVVSKRMSLGNWKVIFEVEKYWKGVNSKRVTIYTSGSETSCGVTFKLGKEYLVPALKHKGKLDVGLCPYLAFNKIQDIYLKKLGNPVSVRNKIK